MGDRRCCCGCLILRDDFHQAPGTELVHWLERRPGGDWEVVWDGDHRVVQVYPDPAHGAVIATKLIFPHTKTRAETWIHRARLNACYRIGIEAPTATPPRWVATHYADALVQADKLTISVFGGDSVEYPGNYVGSSFPLTVWFAPQGNRTFLGAGVAGCDAWSCVPNAAGPCRLFLAALGPPTVLHQWDWVQWDRHQQALDTCPTCGCLCDDECIPKRLKIRLIDEEGCSAYHGAQWDVDYQGTQGPYCGYWSPDHEKVFCDYYRVAPHVLKRGDTPGVDGWTFYNTGGSLTSWQIAYADPNRSTCYPLVITSYPVPGNNPELGVNCCDPGGTYRVQAYEG